jgi:hypothetical protein
LVSSLYAQCDVPTLSGGDAVAILARLMATDLRVRPAIVTAPVIRLVPELAVPVPESDLSLPAGFPVSAGSRMCASTGRPTAQRTGGELVRVPGRPCLAPARLHA